MQAEVKFCPNCGADVEGLIHHCDCCGELLYSKKVLFSRMTYCTGAFFDIDVYLNAIFDRLNEIDSVNYEDVLERIEFDFWCFPIEKRPGVRFYPARKRAIVTIEVDDDAYIYGTKEEKRALLTDEISANLKELRRRFQKRGICADDLFVRAEKKLQENLRQPIE